jgi:hypothetical protein
LSLPPKAEHRGIPLTLPWFLHPGRSVVVRLDADYHRFGSTSRFTPIGARPDIEPEFVEQADEEAIRTSVVEAARTAMAYRVGKAVVYALAKRANEDWSEGDLATALAKESLSLAADDYLESLSRVRRQVRDAVLLVLGKNNLLDQLPAVVDIFPSANVPPDLFSKHDLIASG